MEHYHINENTFKGNQKDSKYIFFIVLAILAIWMFTIPCLYLCLASCSNTFRLAFNFD